MIRKRQIEIEEEISPFIMMRVGIFEHIRSGWMDADMFVVYSLMLHLCDWETGVWHGCAANMAAALNNIWSIKKVERILRRLANMRYITATYKVGVTGSYDILINNFTPTKGSNAMKVKLRPVQAGNPLTTSDKSVGAVVGVGTYLSEGGSDFVGGSDKNVRGVGMNLSGGGHKIVGGTDKNVLHINNSFQESLQGINSFMEKQQQQVPPPSVFDEEEA
jgi:hypothetical protein